MTIRMLLFWGCGVVCVDLMCGLNARKEQKKKGGKFPALPRGKFPALPTTWAKAVGKADTRFWGKAQLCQQPGPKLLAKLPFPLPTGLCQQPSLPCWRR
jgi:hypothetical protein